MKFFLSLISLLIVAVMVVAFYAVSTYRAAGPLTESVTLVIPKGTGTLAMADALKQQSIITDKYIFIAAAKLRGSASLKAGEYEFAPGESISMVLTKIINGDIVKHQFTIPEGLTSHEIVERLKKEDGLSGDITDVPAEGTLLPETYQYQSGDTKQKKIETMKAAMTSAINELWAKRSPDLPFMTPEEAVTLASIVEKETGKASERKTIAGVFINRLKQGIPLQSDPTVIYALTKGKPENGGQGPLGRRLLLKDLEMDSPYNTYKNTGLPPGPIANPGRDALEAVLHPETNDFLYFVADGTGGHVFAKTFADHNRNVEEWRRIRRSAQQN